LFGKILDSAKAMPAYREYFSLKWVQQWVKKGLEIKTAITMPPKFKGRLATKMKYSFDKKLLLFFILYYLQVF
jgi:hypothetical protein